MKFGNGSVYLAGPRNRKGKSWRVDAVNKIAKAGLQCTIFIPESVGQLKGGFCRLDKEEKSKWQKFAIASATTVLFWYPPDASEDVGVADLKAWCKSERVFIGRDPENKTQVVEDLMQNDQNVVVVNSLDALVEKMAAWVNR